MTQEQAIVYAAIIAAVVSILPLIVTIIGWWATYNSQKQLLERQIKADKHRDVWQQVNVPRIQELRELKSWLEEGMRVRDSQWIGKEEAEWQQKAHRLIGLVERVESEGANDDYIPLTGKISRYFWTIHFLARVGLGEIGGEHWKLYERSRDELPTLIDGIDELIKKTASSDS